MNFNLWDYEWKLIKTESCQCKISEFLASVEIWLTKPHVLNRRLCASEMILRKKLPDTKLVTFLKDYISSDGLKTEAEGNYTNESSLKQLECCVRKMFPRNRKNNKVAVEEIIIIDYSKGNIVFLPLEEFIITSTTFNLEILVKTVGYKLQFDQGEHSLKLFVGQEYRVPDTGSFSRPSLPWLKNNLFPKLMKWTECNANPGNDFTSLVSMAEYTQLYGDLKEKYGTKFVKLWTEVTDPLKFVYEDVAIAAYILTLWQHERDEQRLTIPQSFIDLGCGNGLLVHILNCEGHRGKGIDVRRRKIWDLYGDETCLEEAAITPSDSNLFPDYDWLIGNHSDELTPWIPVIASRSSFDTRYFVLPCCFHDFNCKFARSNSSQGQYRAYLDFVADIGKTCGFEVEEDRLRIPSTKRICQVGKKRTYKLEDQDKIDLKIKELIQKRSVKKGNVSQPLETCDMQINCSPVSDACSEHGVRGRKRELNVIDDKDYCQKMMCIGERVNFSNNKDSAESKKWVDGFTARSKVERVRNCATVCLDIRQEIISKVAHKLLKEGGVLENESETPASEWRRGGKLDLSAIASFLGSDVLKKLKQECGGLKTLLKNANQIFEVTGNTVQVRDWANSDVQPAKSNQSLKKVQDKELLFKTKHCWFYNNHPDGCPRATQNCPFAHGDEDLRERPIFK